MSSAEGTPERVALDRGRVVDAAVLLADEAGLESLSMRRLGDRLDVSPMALYKHVQGREALIDAMVDRLVSTIAVSPADEPWRARLRARILSARVVIDAHPWARAAIETRTQASDVVLAYMDSLIRILFDGGLSADLVHHAMHALGTRMWGFTREVFPTPTAPDDPSERAAAMGLFAARYPGIVRMATTAPGAGADCDTQAEFEFALDILLDAFELLHERGWSSVAGH